MYTIEEIDNVTRNEKVVDIYGTYYETIAPAIFSLETLDGAFPVEILNEVRSIFTHISRCCITDDIHVYEDNINKAQRHTKRAVLDCYKYLCVSYDEHFKRFEELYANVDLSVIDNGSFLPELKKKRKSAVELILKAKQFDLEGKNEDELYTAYEDAYHAFYDLYKLIEDSYDKLSRAKKLSNKKDIVAIVGLVVGVIGIAVSVFFGIWH